MRRYVLGRLRTLVPLALAVAPSALMAQASPGYDDLVTLFDDLRDARTPAAWSAAFDDPEAAAAHARAATSANPNFHLAGVALALAKARLGTDVPSKVPVRLLRSLPAARGPIVEGWARALGGAKIATD